MNLKPALLLTSIACSWPMAAHGYCRTKTCDADNSCEKDDRGCSLGGKPARWRNGCLTFAVQRDGSAVQGIAADEMLEVAQEAFALWTDSPCHSEGSPPLTFMEQGQVACGIPEYNCDPQDWNANVLMFQDEGWSHSPAALAITCVTMNLDTGEILDADMEINTTPPYFDFSLPGQGLGADLHTVLAHEAGHFIGLDHSHLQGALMYKSYNEHVLISSLSDDDIAGVCDIYGGKERDPSCNAPELPEDTSCVGASSCVPMRREPAGCSCRWASAQPQPGGLSWLALALSGTVAVAFRRRRVGR